MSERLITLRDAHRFNGCVMAYGHFTTIHPGHIRYLKHAQSLGSELVIALLGDNTPGETPYPFDQGERAEALDLLGMANAILMLEGNELVDAIKMIRPAVVVFGTELEGAAELEEPIALLKKLGGEVQFHAGEVHYASAELLTSSERDLREVRRRQFSEACRRQSLDRNELLSSMKTWKKAKLIVLGDTIVDQYAACEAIGMSAEAPVVVVRELAKRNFIGAAAVVAAHIKALGADCSLVSVVGNDSTAEIVINELERQGIGNALTRDNSRPTTFKKRYVVENQKLFRVSRLEEKNIDSSVEKEVMERLESLAKDADAIVVSDFVYGVVTPRILALVQKLAKEHELLLFGDLQCSSQVGSIGRFKNFSLLCPNERELRLAVQEKDTGLESLSQKLVEEARCERLIVKLASEGFIAYDRDKNGNMISQPFPALSVNPVDVSGAGDSVLAVMATGLSSGQDMMKTAAIACCMAARAVEKMGNTPIGSSELEQAVIEALRN